MKIFFTAVVALCAVCVQTAEWDYSTGANGVDNWANENNVCGGEKQSPINIVSAAAEYNESLELFERDWYYTPPTSMELTNNGHSLQMNILANHPVIDNRGVLPFPAKLAQYHFHWAATKGGAGSEHKIDNQNRFGELHLVHYNTKYADLAAAASESDGLAVLGFFLQAGYPQDNEMVDQILDLIETVPYKGNTTTVEKLFSIETFLPPDMGLYYRYEGSLTTPPCYESVLWTVFEQDIRISDRQAEQLATALYSGDDQTSDKIVNNYRPVQPLNNRPVTKARGIVQDSSAAGVQPAVAFSLLTGILAMYL